MEKKEMTLIAIVAIVAVVAIVVLVKSNYNPGTYSSDVNDLDEDNLAGEVVIKCKPTDRTNKCGGTCPQCDIGERCLKNSDCMSNLCKNKKCGTVYMQSASAGCKSGSEEGIPTCEKDGDKCLGTCTQTNRMCLCQ